MKGLNNIGNTCYLNSALQMLLLNHDFCNLILNYNGGTSQILNNISNFIINYYKNNDSSISPNIIKNIIESKYRMFHGFEQHDAYECLFCLFNIINDEINNINKNYNLYNVYGFDLESKVACKLKECNHNNIKIDKELILNLTIENTLKKSFLGFTSKELLIDEYKCDKCNIKSIVSKKLNILSYPKNLLICLKRFDYNNNRGYKINNSIEIPLEIPMLFNKYKLQGAIIHSGSYYSGHYIYIGNINNTWYLFNDNIVNEIHDLNNYLPNAYCLYYKII
jgi:ubiquitin C-terminal hydrolase